MVQRAIGFVVLALILTGALLWSQRRPEREMVSGFVETDEIRVGSRVSGRVAKVLAVEGAEVRKGDPLVEFESYDLKDQRAQAAALLAQKQRDYERLSAGYRPEEIAQARFRVAQLQANFDKLKKGPRKQEIAAGKAELELAQAEVERAKVNNDRIETLAGKGAATPDQRDQAKTDLRVAQATVKVRTENLALLEEGNRPEDIAQAEAQLHESQEALKLMEAGYRTEDIAAAKAAMEATRAQLNAIDRQMEELTVTAPVDGIVEAVELRAGDLVSPNAPVLSMVDMTQLRIRAYVPENQMDLKLGQKLKVTVDSFPKRTFEGTVTFVARQAEFTPSNVQTPEDRSKQVFRVRVALHDPDNLLRPGMQGDVWLNER